MHGGSGCPNEKPLPRCMTIGEEWRYVREISCRTHPEEFWRVLVWAVYYGEQRLQWLIRRAMASTLDCDDPAEKRLMFALFRYRYNQAGGRGEPIRYIRPLAMQHLGLEFGHGYCRLESGRQDFNADDLADALTGDCSLTVFNKKGVGSPTV